MDLDRAKTLVDVVTGCVALAGGLIGALWAYARFVVERGLLPPTEFSLACSQTGGDEQETILEVLLLLKNVGASTLVVTNIRVDLRYLISSDRLELFTDPETDTFGRLRFGRSLHRELAPDSPAPPRLASVSHQSPVKMASRRRSGITRGFRLIPWDTFVQAGVEQVYAFTTVLPRATSYVLVWASFEYAQHPTRVQRAGIWLARRLGLIQFSLDHIREPHTAERVFRISDRQGESSYGYPARTAAPSTNQLGVLADARSS